MVPWVTVSTKLSTTNSPASMVLTHTQVATSP